MKKNLDRLGGLIHSQRVLIALTQKGVAREDAYALVQRNAMQVWRGEGDFLAFLKADKDVKRLLNDAEIEANFDLGHHFKHVDTIFKRGVRRRCRAKAACRSPEDEAGNPHTGKGSKVASASCPWFDAQRAAPGFPTSAIFAMPAPAPPGRH